MSVGKKVRKLKKSIWNISYIKTLIAICCILASTISTCQGIEKICLYHNNAKYSIENVKCIKQKSLVIQQESANVVKTDTKMHFFRFRLTNTKRVLRYTRIIFDEYQICTLKRPRKPIEYFEKVVLEQCFLHYDTLCKLKILQMKDGKKYMLLFENR